MPRVLATLLLLWPSAINWTTVCSLFVSSVPDPLDLLEGAIGAGRPAKYGLCNATDRIPSIRRSIGSDLSTHPLAPASRMAQYALDVEGRIDHNLAGGQSGSNLARCLDAVYHWQLVGQHDHIRVCVDGVEDG